MAPADQAGCAVLDAAADRTATGPATEAYMVKPGINWRSRTEIDEENRHGHYRDGTPKAVAVMTLKCEGCGKEITEVQFSDGHRSYDQHGVRSVLGKGVYCRTCPS